MKIVAQNKKAFHDYDILDHFEAGIVLTGDEVKSVRGSKVSLIGSFATIKQNELYLNNCHIAPYEKAYQKTEDNATRARKLLVHRRELNKLSGEISTEGVTVVPLKIYFNKRGIAKVELGIAKHKKAAGKKQHLREQDTRRETAREGKGRW